YIGLLSLHSFPTRRSSDLDFMWGLDGVEKAASETGLAFKGVETRKETAKVTGKIDFSSHPFLDDFTYLNSIVPEGTVARQTIPSAVQFLYEITKPHNNENTKNIIQIKKIYMMTLYMRIQKHLRLFIKHAAATFKLMKSSGLYYVIKNTVKMLRKIILI